MIVNGGNEKMKNYADDGFPRYQRTRNDLPGCRMTDRPTEQIHQPEQLTNISFSNLMAVGNILEEYSFVCWAGGRYALIYAIPLFHTFFFCTGCNFGNNFWNFTASALSNRNSEHVSFVILLLFMSFSQSSRTWKLNSKNRLRSSKQRKKA